MAITHTPPRGDVVVDLNFYSPPADGSPPWNLAGDVPPGVTTRNFGQAARQVVIHDARGQEDKFTLDHDAFQILTNQPPSAEKDFKNDESIKKNYYPEVEKLLLDAVPSANKVIIFDRTLSFYPPFFDNPLPPFLFESQAPY